MLNTWLILFNLNVGIYTLDCQYAYVAGREAAKIGRFAEGDSQLDAVIGRIDRFPIDWRKGVLYNAKLRKNGYTLFEESDDFGGFVHAHPNALFFDLPEKGYLLIDKIGWYAYGMYWE